MVSDRCSGAILCYTLEHSGPSLTITHWLSSCSDCLAPAGAGARRQSTWDLCHGLLMLRSLQQSTSLACWLRRRAPGPVRAAARSRMRC